MHTGSKVYALEQNGFLGFLSVTEEAKQSTSTNSFSFFHREELERLLHRGQSAAAEAAADASVHRDDASEPHTGLKRQKTASLRLLSLTDLSNGAFKPKDMIQFQFPKIFFSLTQKEELLLHLSAWSLNVYL